MSLQTLLSTETKNEQWSTLNCYSLNCENITATNITGLNVRGGIFNTTGVLSAGSFNFTVGAGTFESAALSSLAMRWNSLVTNIITRQLSFGAQWSAVSGVYVGATNTTNLTLDIILPNSEAFAYPSAIGQIIPGSINCIFRESTSPSHMATGCASFRKNANTITLYIGITGDWSTIGIASRTLEIQGCINYEIV